MKDRVRFDIMVKSYTANSFEVYGSVEIGYPDLMEYARRMKKISLDIVASDKHADDSATLNLLLFEPKFHRSSITQDFYHIGQRYANSKPNKNE